MQTKLKPYWQALLDIFRYQLATKLVIGLWLYALGRIFNALLLSTGRVAVSSGDYAFLFTSWQGQLILVTALASLFIYTAFDLNTKILLSRDLLVGNPVSMRRSMKEAFRSIRAFMKPRGIGVVLYVALVAPLLGLGMSISLTEGLYIPTFISSVINTTPLYFAAVGLLMAVFLIVGIANMFILHSVILDGLSVQEAGLQSKRLMKKNWKDYLKQNLIYAVITGTAGLFATPLYVMKITQLFYTYKEEEKQFYPVREHKRHPVVVSGIVILGIGILAVSFLINRSFEEMFPKEVSAGIVAHRGGGIEGPKNTVAGLNTAWEAGAYGSEIDIQRTKDGHYVVNHDGTFQRTAGDGRTPEEMTLEEVRTLSVDGEPVATFEEMLEAAHGKLILFTELKGDTAALNCDYLGLEEESATADAISAIHAQGKKALVWTANEEKSQKHFLCSEVDGVITDNVRQAAGIVEELEKRTDLERIIDWLFTQENVSRKRDADRFLDVSPIKKLIFIRLNIDLVN